MHTAAKIIKYELHDVVRSKWVAFYGVFFLLLTEGLLRFGGARPRRCSASSTWCSC
ncbi:MAG: hypothetical protein KatS3mg043_0808 [Rhodothermaceae bacterium]|nr:MAG: hypothetical protein KatS3mg043_0808 [Rhodothermaceae bacterium]